MDKSQVKEKLTLHSFTYTTLDSGVRVTALVPGAGATPESGDKRGIIVRATSGETSLESERHASYEDAAARYVELVDKYREE